MEQITNYRGGALSRIVGRLRRAAATFLLQSDRAHEIRLMVMAGDLGSGPWLTPTELGLDPNGGRSPAWYRTDVAVYALRYQTDWGKAEMELPQDGEVTRLRIVSREIPPRKAA